MTEQKKTASRIYVCHDKLTGDVKVVRANNPSQAINYWTRERINVRVAKAEDMIGVQKTEILDATADVHPDQQPLPNL